MKDSVDIFDETAVRTALEVLKTHEECAHCNGYGSSLKEENDRCSKCGGSGLLKKEGL